MTTNLCNSTGQQEIATLLANVNLPTRLVTSQPLSTRGNLPCKGGMGTLRYSKVA